MSSLSSLYITRAKLAELLHVVDAKQEKGVELTISISDTTNEYGQNVSSYVAQSKEQREAKKTRFYTGNGKCFWTDGNIRIATKQDAAPAPTSYGTERDPSNTEPLYNPPTYAPAPSSSDEIGTPDSLLPF